MLKQAGLQQIKDRSLTKKDGYLVVVMRKYPRWIKKTLFHEYIGALSSTKELLNEFLQLREDVTGDHNKAFSMYKYEEKFNLSIEGMNHLKRLVELSRKKDVYLICQCKDDQKCHRDLLLLMAKELFGAKVETPRFKYPKFLQRIR